MFPTMTKHDACDKFNWHIYKNTIVWCIVVVSPFWCYLQSWSQAISRESQRHTWKSEAPNAIYEFGESLIELYTLKLITGFQQLVHLPSSSLVNRATTSPHLVEQKFNIWHKSTTIWKASWSLYHWETHDKTTTSKITYNDINEAFIAKEWIFSIS